MLEETARHTQARVVPRMADVCAALRRFLRERHADVLEGTPGATDTLQVDLAPCYRAQSGVMTAGYRPGTAESWTCSPAVRLAARGLHGAQTGGVAPEEKVPLKLLSDTLHCLRFPELLTSVRCHAQREALRAANMLHAEGVLLMEEARAAAAAVLALRDNSARPLMAAAPAFLMGDGSRARGGPPLQGAPRAPRTNYTRRQGGPTVTFARVCHPAHYLLCDPGQHGHALLFGRQERHCLDLSL